MEIMSSFILVFSVKRKYCKDTVNEQETQVNGENLFKIGLTILMYEMNNN